MGCGGARLVPRKRREEMRRRDDFGKRPLFGCVEKNNFFIKPDGSHDFFFQMRKLVKNFAEIGIFCPFLCCGVSSPAPFSCFLIY